MMKLFGVLAAVTLVAGVGLAEDKKPADDKAGKLSGTYTVVSGEKDGKAVPKERIDGSMIKFSDSTVVGTDKDKKEFYSASYTLDTTKTPWVITMTAAKKDADKKESDKKDGEKKDVEKKDDGQKGETAVGLIKADGDTVTVIYALPGGKTPTEFKTGENQQMFVLKREEKK
jgi:uncharacterized protein (TIGR03067 family)